MAARFPVPDEDYRELFSRLSIGAGTPADRVQFAKTQRELSAEILTAHEDRLFTVTTVAEPLIERPCVSPSMPCASCGELTMQGRLERRGRRFVCSPCLAGSDPSGPPRVGLKSGGPRR